MKKAWTHMWEAMSAASSPVRAGTQATCTCAAPSRANPNPRVAASQCCARVVRFVQNDGHVARLPVPRRNGGGKNNESRPLTKACTQSPAMRSSWTGRAAAAMPRGQSPS
eukprot:Tamp_26583.p1 GENE.Tamp_26583~~Tamp_26583.p1  ORF type:complete len:110 (+),score=6.68 Tamp_26583:259-588(+)